MGKPVSLKGYMHTCPMIDPGPKPHFGGPIIDTGQDFVTVNGIPVATVSSIALCNGVSTNRRYNFWIIDSDNQWQKSRSVGRCLRT